LVRSQPREIPCKTLSQKRAAGVVEGEGPEFKSQYQKKKKRFTLKCNCHCNTVKRWGIHEGIGHEDFTFMSEKRADLPPALSSC
jgi:hypothetical protein